MALAVAEMPATGTYDFGWVVEHVRNSKEQAGSGGDKRLILVDVGGGQGQILKSILEQNPEIPPNRCVLEDQSNEAVHANVDGVMSSVGRQVTSFFHEQPIKGTFYERETSILTGRKNMGQYPAKQSKGKLEQNS
jgi:hypothetical protein